MELVQNWIYTIASAVFIITVISVLCPKNSAGRVVALCGNIILALVVLVPVKRFDMSLVEAYEKEISEIITEKTARLAEVNADLTDKVIAENIDAYISKQLDDAGIECTVKSICKGNDIDSVKVGINNASDAEKVKNIVVTELGVNPVKLMFKAGENDEASALDFR